MKIKLTKNGIGDKIMLSGGEGANSGKWITNGRWVIARDMVENGEMMTTPAAMEALLKLKHGTAPEGMTPDVAVVLKPGADNPKLRRFTFTGWQKQCGNHRAVEWAYCYEHAETGEQLFLDSLYVDMLAPMFSGACYAESPTSLAFPALFDTVESVTAVLMPIKLSSFKADREERAALLAADQKREAEAKAAKEVKTGN